MEGALSLKSEGKSMKWITREDAKVDRIACPWLIRKFIDKEAEFLFVPKDCSASWGCGYLRGWWGSPWGFESPLRYHRSSEREFGLAPSSLFP
jgi:hypothetical protein